MAEVSLHVRGDHMLNCRTAGATWSSALGRRRGKVQSQAKKVKGKWAERKRQGAAVRTPRAPRPAAAGARTARASSGSRAHGSSRCRSRTPRWSWLPAGSLPAVPQRRDRGAQRPASRGRPASSTLVEPDALSGARPMRTPRAVSVAPCSSPRSTPPDLDAEVHGGAHRPRSGRITSRISRDGLALAGFDESCARPHPRPGRERDPVRREPRASERRDWRTPARARDPRSLTPDWPRSSNWSRPAPSRASLLPPCPRRRARPWRRWPRGWTITSRRASRPTACSWTCWASGYDRRRSGIGKSECGSTREPWPSLVADDVVELRRRAESSSTGPGPRRRASSWRCAGSGLIDVQAIFGCRRCAR